MTRRVPALVAPAAHAVLTLLYARALGGLVGLPMLALALVAGAAAGTIAGRSRFRAWVAFAGGAVVFAAARVVSLGIVSVLASSSLAPATAAFLHRLDAGSLAAIPVVALAFAGALARERRPGLIRWEPLVHGALVLALLWSQAHYGLTYFERPWVYVLVVGTLALLNLVLLVDPRALSVRGLVRSASIAVPLLVVALVLSVRWYSAGGAEAGGGILRPTLFRFDFAPFVRLESEISMSDDLVLLYRRSGRARRELIRRFVLTDYDPRRGFSVADASPERSELDPDAWLERDRVRQEYFLVNLDPGTRLGLNEPVEFVRFETWNDSSFTAAFAAESLVSRAPPFRLARAQPSAPDEPRFAQLTDYGDDEAIASLAREITDGLDGAYARARAIELYLQDNYLYSLRPGIAADGDQLSHFLFQAKKGYCSYFAFGMALMVRSLGIPARVAVGFFVDPGQEVLNFYPVLANMAHAWVEVLVGDYGWISFDPTSSTLAPGEEYELGSGADARELALLLEEILAQDLLPVDAAPDSDADAAEPSAALVRSVLARWYLVGPALYALVLAFVRLAPLVALLAARRPARRTVIRTRVVLRRLAACGIRRSTEASLRQFGEESGIDAMPALMELYERALFAPRHTRADDEKAALAARNVVRGMRATVPLASRIAAALVPFRRLSPHAATPHRAVALVALLLVCATARAQEPADWYRAESAEAIAAERYDRAVEILTEAQRYHRASAEFFMLLGDLYYAEQLYRLALEQYLAAEEREPATYEVLEAAAFTLGLLNREEESAGYWQRLVDLFPDRIEPVRNLGWLLFKLHRLDEGIELLLDAWERFGPDADLAMTLGTLHAEQYRFARARDWYRSSIELADAAESARFVAVAFYNLSLVQKLFHRYEDALESTDASIDILPRPTGYLARGELHELRMDFASAHADYLRAYQADDETPLARLNLAMLYRRFGRLDEALAFAQSVREETDNAWLYYYGTDLIRHRMEVHDLLADVHAALARRERMRAVDGPAGWVARLARSVRHAVLGWYHRARFRDYAARVAADVIAGGNLIDGNWHLYRATEGRPAVAASYLERAREREVSLIPESASSYAVEQGLLHRDPRRLLATAAALDSVWQRSLLEESLAGALASGRGPADRGRAAADLYRVNPGAFRQNGISLPVALDAPPALASTRLRRMLARVGLRVEPRADTSLPRLVLRASDGELAARLEVPGREASATVACDARRPSAAAINELADALFAVE